MAAFNDDALKNLLRCPKTRTELVRAGDSLVCIDPDARLRYPIIDGFPILLIDEATALTEAEWSSIMRGAGRDPVTGAPTNLPLKG